MLSMRKDDTDAPLGRVRIAFPYLTCSVGAQERLPKTAQ